MFEMSIIRVIKKFETILSSRQKARILLLVFMMIIGGVLETCSVSLILPFVNAVMEPEETMNNRYVGWFCEWLQIESPRVFLIVIAIALAALYLLKNVYLLFEFNIQYKFVYGNMFAMQQRLLNSYICRPYEFFLKVDSGEIVRIVNTDTPNSFQLLSTLLSLFTETVVSGMLIAAVFIIAPMVTIIMGIILLVLIVTINIMLKPILSEAGISYQEAGAGMNKWLLQSIQGIKELKVMMKEDFFEQKFNSFGKKYVNSLRKSYILGLSPKFIIEACSMSTMFIVVAVLIYNGNGLESIVPMLSAVAMAAMRLLPSVNRMSSALAGISYNEPMLDKLIENLKNINEENLISEGGDFSLGEDIIKEGLVPKLKKEIVFQRVTYHYPDSESNVLESASMTIKRGESVGIVGKSGAGKTTAVDIILGLLRPQEGQILIDGIDIRQNMNEWLNQLGYIPQMIFMLNDSIKANVAFGIPQEKISDNEVWRALREASLEEFVRSLPDGLETQIGERGIRLSGGQRQRIGIARALYQSPEVLIFDEATSALDNETELAIMESINRLRGQKTMIIIAHRLSTIESCDHIYRVDNREIIAE